ncbi:hypothetical protein BHE90_012714 [Fusarium euwallaceae]|uniref:Uncharacterized protein n=1 Tax=Fusarium euwallaceae TaxID=1147111 RepID=A0A430LAW5_9HYPO|nr:hypothetical protein BHE90_012714 [Fusarium euwallaceae]
MEDVLARLMRGGHMTATCAAPILVPESESGASSTTLRRLYSKTDNLRVAASLQDVAQPAKSMLSV